MHICNFALSCFEIHLTKMKYLQHDVPREAYIMQFVLSPDRLTCDMPDSQQNSIFALWDAVFRNPYMV